MASALCQVGITWKEEGKEGAGARGSVIRCIHPLFIQQIPMRQGPGSWTTVVEVQELGGQRTLLAGDSVSTAWAGGWGQGAPGPGRLGGIRVGDREMQGEPARGWANAEGWWGHWLTHMWSGEMPEQVNQGARRAVNAGARLWWRVGSLKVMEHIR